MDQSGAAVGGAAISAVCPDTNQTRVVTSGSGGEYRLADMAVCIYKVSVSSQGFKTTVRNVTVTLAQETKADFRLEVGQRNETITVEAAGPLVEFTSGELNNEVDTKSIVDLPTEGRDFKSILALTPGVQRTPGGGFLDVSVSGQRTTTNNYMIDGADNNEVLLGIVTTLPPPEALGEFKLQTNTFSAEFGRAGGAVINVTTRSGTNEIHGSLYEFLRNSSLDARGPFDRAGVGPDRAAHRVRLP